MADGTTVDIPSTPTISIEQAAPLLGMGVSTLYRLARQEPEEVPFIVTIGRRRLVSTERLRRFLNGESAAA